uniref:PABC domain-containing protein n=1 Tax=Panagrolaimus davidi TaxID=227884 RepID=A0A914Q895_9BILA
MKKIPQNRETTNNQTSQSVTTTAANSIQCSSSNDSATIEELHEQLRKEKLKLEIQQTRAISNVLFIGNKVIEYNQVHYSRGPMHPQLQGGQRPTRMPMQGQPGTVHPNMPPNAGQQQYYQQYNPAAAQQQHQMSQKPIRQPVEQEPLNTDLLAQASDAEQKQIIGERLFHLISHIATNDDVGKITGMMLYLDNSELLVILENDDMLKSKVAEVKAVLHGSQKKPQRD